MDYHIGIVAGTSEVSESQYKEIVRRLRFIHAHVPPGHQVVLRIAARELRFPESTVSPELLRLTFKTHQLQVLKVWKQLETVPAFLYEQLKDCDEVWCLTGPHQTTRAKARAMSLYQHAQKLGERAVRFKQIPAYVEDPVSEMKDQKKGSTKWIA